MWTDRLTCRQAVANERRWCRDNLPACTQSLMMAINVMIPCLLRTSRLHFAVHTKWTCQHALAAYDSSCRAFSPVYWRLKRYPLFVMLIFRRPFIIRFAQCYRRVVCPVLSVTLVNCGQTVEWIKMPLGMEAHCVRWGPSCPHGKGYSGPLPTFRPMSIVTKRSPISAAAELLLQGSLVWQTTLRGR